ncbi:glycosyltransferase family 2 protein [Solidesulfovibrio sp.]|uniref:glycosyltransferase family 2 protein n=1 Tax=Solidesulfovibrio sp. TaxID=2910990 RepID=UPI002B20A873|nr:glycosyltransferase family 2 protein [Solidesulfovibrio sp.]MEA5090481.1 glycosyltransferase family 2 protein [Solidesulfovibrio sp.]
MNTARPEISIVIPVYNAEATIARLVGTLLAEPAARRLQVVLVNDGSRDGSHQVCLDLCRDHPDTVTYLNLAKNFGEHNAVMAGLNHARGDYAVIMDDDFQNPPEEVGRLVAAARDGGFDVVYTSFPEKRHDWHRNIGSAFNDRVATWLLGKPRDLYLSSFKCLSRFLVETVTAYKGPAPYVDGLILRATRNIGVIEVEHRERAAGQSGYTLRKLIRLWLTMFVNFSVMPLRLSAILGLCISGFGLLMGVWSFLEKIFSNALPKGWPMLYITMVIFSGIQLVMLGVLGEYVGRVLLEINRTPQFVVRETHGFVEDADERA